MLTNSRAAAAAAASFHPQDASHCPRFHAEHTVKPISAYLQSVASFIGFALPRTPLLEWLEDAYRKQ